MTILRENWWYSDGQPFHCSDLQRTYLGRCDDVEGYSDDGDGDHDDGGDDDDNDDGGEGDDGDDGGDQSNLQRAYLGRPWRQVRVTMTA